MIVLDTNAWLWWLHNPAKLTKRARHKIEKTTANGKVSVSVISLWEVALKHRLGKLYLPMDIDSWWAQARVYPGIVMEPLSPAEAIASTRLPGDFHRDPADRFIVALARRYGAPLITADQKIIAYPYVETIW